MTARFAGLIISSEFQDAKPARSFRAGEGRFGPQKPHFGPA